MRGVLAPDIAQPFRSHADRKHSTVNEAKVSAGRLIHGSARTDFVKLFQNNGRIAGSFRKRFIQTIHRLQRCLFRKDRPLFQSVDVFAGKLTGLVEQR